jgi:hypothetical protein
MKAKILKMNNTVASMKQLRGIYSDKEVINLLNTVSKKKALQTTLNDTHDLLTKKRLWSYRPRSDSKEFQTEYIQSSTQTQE